MTEEHILSQIMAARLLFAEEDFLGDTSWLHEACESPIERVMGSALIAALTDALSRLVLA